MVEAHSTATQMGNGKPLDADVRARLIRGLQEHPTTLIYLAFDEDNPVGAAVCFIGFSTFAAKAAYQHSRFRSFTGSSRQRRRTALAGGRGERRPGSSVAAS